MLFIGLIVCMNGIGVWCFLSKFKVVFHRSFTVVSAMRTFPVIVMLPFCQQFLQVISRKIYGSVKLSFVHDHQHRKWLHLDTCQFMRLVESDVPRVMCPKRCCQPLPVAWTGPAAGTRCCSNCSCSHG